MQKQITIAGNPLRKYKIVYGTNPEAAVVLQKYLADASGVTLPLIHDCAKNEFEIRVGSTNRTCSRLHYDGLTKDGFVVKVAGGNLIIRGNTPQGDMNGVYDFLERCIGWRFLHRDVDYLKDGDVDLPEGFRRTFSPPYEYRQLDWICTNDGEWRRKNGINFSDFHWVGFVHTLADLSELHDPYGQPCLSDEKILETVKKNVRRLLDQNPDCKILSVSQNDNQNYCKCPRCQAVDAEEGSHAGTLLRFVNAVADDIRDDYPDVSIETLAYQYTRKAPRLTRPRDNVIIRLCSIECCFSHPLLDSSCEVNAAFHHDIVEWGKICNRLYIWDYVTDFTYYIPPFPNFRVLLENMRFFADNHVVGMYPEGNYQSDSGEFGELRAYLLGRAMWNPYMTGEEYNNYMNDFLEGYYGREAAPYLRKFIDFTLAASEGRHFSIWQKPFEIIPREVYTTHFDEIEGWWNEAEKAAGANKQRVQKSRLQWTYI
ncbi:MAG: DUF4838 domain-containing protein, partial [Eubacteriales bacterium]